MEPSWLFDERTKCWSVQTMMTIQKYLDLVHQAHESQGAISGQRSTLSTSTAKRIRTRMVSDISQGAILPPVVIGLVLKDQEFESLNPDAEIDSNFLNAERRAQLSIIDGMQRTAALKEALGTHPDIAGQQLRVEFWITTSVRSMVYRMLVLNTGQVPWTLNRQLTVVYAPLLEEIKGKVPNIGKITTSDSKERRVLGGQYQFESLVELYIAFSIRKTSVDLREQVSDEFSRLDFVDNVAEHSFQEQFYGALSMLAQLDLAFSKFDGNDDATKLTRGRNIFDSQPARIGFMVAVGLEVLGRPGANTSIAERGERLSNILLQFSALIRRLEAMTHEELGEFLSLDILREVLDRRVGQVGRYERAVYGEAFKVLIEENFSLTDMAPCWRAQ